MKKREFTVIFIFISATLPIAASPDTPPEQEQLAAKPLSAVVMDKQSTKLFLRQEEKEAQRTRVVQPTLFETCCAASFPVITGLVLWLSQYPKNN
jgi:hypothetical protein